MYIYIFFHKDQTTVSAGRTKNITADQISMQNRIVDFPR